MCTCVCVYARVCMRVYVRICLKDVSPHFFLTLSFSPKDARVFSLSLSVTIFAIKFHFSLANELTNEQDEGWMRTMGGLRLPRLEGKKKKNIKIY